MNKADVAEIVRHFVDEEWRALPVNTGGIEELLAVGTQCVSIQRGKALRVSFALRSCAVPVEALGQRGDMVQLHGAVNRRVR